MFVLVHIEYGTPQRLITPAKGDNKDLAEGEDKNYPSRLKELTILRRQAMNGDYDYDYRDQPLNDPRGRLFAALRDQVLARPLNLEDVLPAQPVVRQNPVSGQQPVVTGGNRRWQTNQMTQNPNMPKPISTRKYKKISTRGAVLQHNDNAQMSSRLSSLPKIFERSQSSKIPQPISTSASSRRSYVPPPTQPQSPNQNDARFFDVSQSSKIPRLIGTSASSPRSYIRPPTQPQSPNQNDARCPQLGCGPNKTRPNSGLRPPSAIWRDRSQIKSQGYMKSLMEQAQSRPGPIRRPPRLRPAIPNWQKRQQSKNQNYARFLEK